MDRLRGSRGSADPVVSGSTSRPSRRPSWKARIWSSTARSTSRTSTSGGTSSTVGAKFRIDRIPAATSARRGVLRGRGRRGDDADRHLPAADDLGQSVLVADGRRPRARRPTLSGSTSTMPAMVKPRSEKPANLASAEPRLPAPTITHFQLWVRPELTADLDQEALDVVADAPGPVRAEVGEVLADLGGVDAGEVGQLLGRHRRPALGLELHQAAVVHREARDGGVGERQRSIRPGHLGT